MHTQIISGIKAGQSVVTEIVVDASEDEENSQPQNLEGNIYNEERHSFLSYSHPGLTAGANSSFY